LQFASALGSNWRSGIHRALALSMARRILPAIRTANAEPLRRFARCHALSACSGLVKAC
jgi:hypothetical protein